MGRTLGVVVASLALGAAVMYAASHYRIRLEPAAAEGAAKPAEVAPPAPVAEPGLLPASVTPPSVRPASHQVPVVPALLPVAMAQPPAPPGPPPPTQIGQAEVGELLDGRTLVWNVSSARDVKLHTSKGTVVLRLTDPPKDANRHKLIVVVNDTPYDMLTAGDADLMRVRGVAVDSPENPTQLTVTLRPDLFPQGGGLRVGVVARPVAPPGGTDGGARPATFVTLAPPGPSAAGRVVVAAAFDSPYLTAPVTADPFVVVNGYLRLKGQAFAPQADVKFFLVRPNTPVTPVPGAKVTLATATDWEAELNLGPQPAGTEGHLLVRLDSADGSFYLPTARRVQWQPKGTPARPAFAAADPIAPLTAGKNAVDAASSTADMPVYRATATTFTVKVTRPTDAQVLVLSVGDQRAAVAAVAADAVVTFANVKVPGDGDHLVTVVAANGGETGPAAKLLVRVKSVGPRVVSLAAPGFGTGGGRETISVQFAGEDLDPATAIDPQNYELTHNEGDKANNANRKTVAGTVGFDPAARTVKLTYAGVVPGTYTFVVKQKGAAATDPGGVRDVFGNSLVGPNGTTTENFTATLNAVPTDAALPSQAAGVTLQTGKNVTFPEFTPFRKVPDGFNPDDHVETRVVRLYYNRDAHRVAQIVNRDVKSYNAATVDVRRRAADRARDDANKVTDERMRLEREAVRLSIDARQAERELQQATAQAAESRTRSQQAAILVGQKQDDLVAAQRDLQRARAAAAPQTATEEAVAPFQTRVTTLANELALARQQQKEIDDATAIDEKQAMSKVDDARNRLRDARTRRDKAQQDLRLNGSPTSGPLFDALQVAQQQFDSEQNNLSRTEGELNTVRQATLQAKNRLDLLQQQLDQATRSRDRAVKEADARNAPDLLAEQQQQQISEMQRQITNYRQVVANGETNAAQLQATVSDARQRVAAARQQEAVATEAWQAKDQEELRRKEDQFRREVAAAREDPDTYAPGKPGSDDPVRQCSISVVGEGLIHLRGPVKGLNIIRIMINQLDAPVGQVRIGVHTVQVNGERGDRMEKVVANIQRYIDHSRFLTAQSSQMLRKAVTLVASRKADQVMAELGPGCSQQDRDRKYLYAFYGKDFIDELYEIDSEFLRTGNKLLSLNSMDSTSLSAALFQMSLAKNSVRTEILQEFNAQVTTCLPAAEQNFYLAGLSGHKCEACLDKHQYSLAYNAKFQSLAGYFNGEVVGDDTLNPLQREFVRLAQIFKSRMITELQLKQRVMERALLEERVGDYLKELREARENDDAARKELAKFQLGLAVATAGCNKGIIGLLTNLDVIEEEVSAMNSLLDTLKRLKPDTSAPFKTRDGKEIMLRGAQQQKSIDMANQNGPPLDFKNNPEARRELLNLSQFLDQFEYLGQGYKEHYDNVARVIDQVKNNNNVVQGEDKSKLIDGVRVLAALIREEAKNARMQLRRVLESLKQDRPDPASAFADYRIFRESIMARLRSGQALKNRATEVFAETDPAFKQLADASAQFDAASRKAQLARRPLDEKKLLDLLVDETEDKYAELLEGTRAHTANVDNYLKTLSTALEDDFNTQFYYPSFRRVREASRYWDVTLAQIETTTVLTNNRAFAKVDPAATFEFDLPKRNIMITEGFQAAKALMDDYGALLGDPTFLAATKLYSGQPVAGQFGTGGGASAVRNVLPGLSSSADELLLAQSGPGNKQVGSALESLIPDPSIYKFETGTGYEIRPVLSPDGQAVVFNFNYMYSTNVREPVRAGEKHLGRVKRHFVHTDVQLSNYELREVSKYQVALKAARTGRGVQLLQDIPGVGVLFRPLPSAESALQQNLIYAQTTIFPTLFDLMGLRYAPAVADLDPLADRNDEWVVRSRRRDLEQRVYDVGASRVDDALRIPYGERRPDLYRPQVTLPAVHPNGYFGPGLKLRDSTLLEGGMSPYSPEQAYPATPYSPGNSYSVPHSGYPSRTPSDMLMGPSFGPPGMSAPGFGQAVPFNAPPSSTALGQPRQVPPPSTTLGPPRTVPPATGSTTVRPFVPASRSSAPAQTPGSVFDPPPGGR